MFTKKHITETILLATPVIISQLGHISVGVADTFMAGQISKDALATVTVAFSVFYPLFMMYVGFSFGFTPLIAQALGEEDHEKIARIFKHACWLNIVIGSVLTIILLFGMYLIPYLNQPAHIIGDAIRFFSIIAASLFPIVVFQIMKQFIEGMGQTRQAMVVSMLGNVINIALIFLLVNGWLNLPMMGLMGIAYATLIARIAMALIMLVYFFLAPQYRLYRNLYKKISLKSVDFIAVFNKSYPVGLQMTFETSAFSAALLFIGAFGTVQMAAHQIALNLASVTYMAATGIAAAATVRVGFEYGRKNQQDLRQAGFTAILLTLILMGGAALLFTVLHTLLPSIMTNDQEVIHVASLLLCMVAFFQLSDGVQVVSMGSLRGMGDVLIPSSVAFAAYWLIGLPLGWTLAFKLGWEVYGIWVGLTTGLVIASLVLLIRFIRKSKSVIFEDSMPEGSASTTNIHKIS